MTENSTPTKILLPEGRLINSALFAKDTYVNPNNPKAEATPQYKVELAFDAAQIVGEGTVEDALIDAVCERWGDSMEDDWVNDKNILKPYISGDRLAADREARNKPGDAYKGKIVIRPNTIFNKHGADGPGGIQVFGPDTSKIEAANQDELYPGCYGIAAVTLGTYTDPRTGNPGVKFYLSAFQKTRDGERLFSVQEHSGLFKPIGREATGGEGGTTRRRSRKG